MRRRLLFLLLPLLFPLAAFAQPNTSALISQALDRPIISMTVQGSLEDVLRTIEAQTGVHVTPSPTTLADLPWGDQTTLHVNVQNTTLRETLDAISQHLGLLVSSRSDRVELEPTPALARIGRRATVGEIATLDFLASTPLPTLKPPATVKALLDDVNTTLDEHNHLDSVQEELPATGPATAPATRPAIDPAALAPGQVIRLSSNLTLLQALEQLDQQTPATWVLDGSHILVISKTHATLQRLQRRLTRRFQDVPLQQVLLELSEAADVTFAYAPGVLQEVPTPYQKVTLVLDDATIEQTLQSIGSLTGLAFEAQAHQVWFTLAEPKLPTTRTTAPTTNAAPTSRPASATRPAHAGA